MKLKFKICFKSDYHIGAGYGKGVVDSIILKDKEGFPIIRGTTLAGLLRQGMWELLQTGPLNCYRKCQQSLYKGDAAAPYCFEKEQVLACPLCRILGSPLYSKRWNISSARMNSPSVLKPEKIVWRNKINPRTNTTEAGKLFNEEVAGGKIIFEFTVEKDVNDMNTMEEAAFIAAAFRMVRNIGKTRRRGRGLCEIRLIKINPKLPVLKDVTASSPEDILLEVFRIRWLEQREIKILTQNRTGKIKQKRGFSVNNSAKGKMNKSFNLILLTKEPLLVANKSETGNRFQTNDYIPGTTILGALAWKAARRHDLTDERVYDQFSSLFLQGGVKVTPVYPCLKIGDDIYPAISSPMDFLTCKLFPEHERGGHGIKSYAALKEEPKKCDRCFSDQGIEIPLEPLDGYVPLYPKTKTVEVVKKEEMHITIDPVTGRTRTGDLFSYEVMETGQYFAGTISVEDWDSFSTLLGIDDSFFSDIFFKLRIGKASTRGYGLAQIWLQKADTMVTFHGKAIEKRVDKVSEPITMTLLSDAILIDRWGRFYSALDNEKLKKILGVEVKVINTYVKNKSIDGFNAYLGLPKWRENAIAAGSSVGFTIKKPVDPDDFLEKLRVLEREGIGLRKTEGFGRIVFNHPIYDQDNGVSVRINLPKFMRIQKKEETVKNFKRRWQTYLSMNLQQKDFLQVQWGAVSRWLRGNSKKPLPEIKKMYAEFHVPEKITGLIDQKSPIRDKVKSLEDWLAARDYNSINKALKKLEEKIKKTKIVDENKEIEKYLQSEAIEMLADHIEFLRSGA